MLIMEKYPSPVGWETLLLVHSSNHSAQIIDLDQISALGRIGRLPGSHEATKVHICSPFKKTSHDAAALLWIAMFDTNSEYL